MRPEIGRDGLFPLAFDAILRVWSHAQIVPRHGLFEGPSGMVSGNGSSALHFGHTDAKRALQGSLGSDFWASLCGKIDLS
jgi:hypothetical protein